LRNNFLANRAITVIQNKASHFTAHGIELHPPSHFEGMRKAGLLAAQVLDMITDYVVPNVTTEELDQRCHDFIIQNGAIPAPLNYKGYPKSICTSINHVVCHGIPSNKKLVKGDIVNIDVTVILDGWYGDTSRMYAVGDVSVKAQKLMDVTYECLMRSIDIVKEGAFLSDIGKTIQRIAEKERFSVVRDFCGHGLGRSFHAPPSVLHYFDPSAPDIMLEAGMFFTIEPMINAGGWETKILSDNWTAVTRDRSLSAQFEHSLAVTKDGCEIFTLSPLSLTKPPYKK
jgi:methionyl aminopeptidase